MDPFPRLVRGLLEADVRFVLIGVWGANLYASAGHAVFSTQDHDLFLPPDVEGLLRAWAVCRAQGLSLFAGTDPLDMPRDRQLAEAVVARRALVRASNGRGFDVDLTLVMTGFDFETVWNERRIFRVDDIEVPVARLAHIVRSKAAAGRDKDRLFLVTYAETLAQFLERDDV